MRFYINPHITELVVQYSRAIAKTRGYPVKDLVFGLQKRETLEEKRKAERQEAREAHTPAEIRAELADFCRYSILLDVVAPVPGKPHAWYVDALAECHTNGFDQEEIEVAMLVKYGIRQALPYLKDKETLEEKSLREKTELAAIQAALDALQGMLVADEHWPGWTLPEVAELYDIPMPTLYKLASGKPLPPFVRKSGEKTTLFNLYHPEWRRWLTRYQIRERRQSPPASTWPDPEQDNREFA